MEPTIGRIVHYRVKKEDLERLAEQRVGALHHRNIDLGVTEPYLQPHHGNPVNVGDVLPMVITRPWHSPGHYVKGESVLNGHALTDGEASLWVLSVPEGEGPGTWSWPPRS